MAAAVLGPSLPNLAEQTHVQLKQASILFSATNLGFLIGALTSGRIFDRRTGHPIIAIALLVMAAMMALVPAVPRLELIAMAVLVLGISQAFMDIGGNTLLVWLHRERVGPFMNGLHLFWGIGAFLSPILIAQAILRTGNYAWAYWLIALLLLPISLSFGGTLSPAAPHREPGTQPAKKPGWRLVGLFVLFYLTFVGAEGAYGGWIYSYAVTTKIAAPATAAYLTSAYWGALTLSRLVSIPLAMRFRPRTLLIANLVGCLLGLSLGVFGGSSPVLIWIATIIFGASIATMFPVGLSFANSMLSVTGQFTSLIFVGSSLGGMLVPWLIGQFFEQVGPHSMMVILLVDMVISVGFFVFLNRIKTPSGNN
jgi:fucose permease